MLAAIEPTARGASTRESPLRAAVAICPKSTMRSCVGRHSISPRLAIRARARRASARARCAGSRLSTSASIALTPRSTGCEAERLARAAQPAASSSCASPSCVRAEEAARRWAERRLVSMNSPAPVGLRSLAPCCAASSSSSQTRLARRPLIAAETRGRGGEEGIQVLLVRWYKEYARSYF
eukprot:scaffold272675_cov31-Tisochrysis_lutea.AAC.1